MRLRRVRLDVALGAVGVALGLPSLLYPLGRDQGLYYYVAREWVLRGSVPYRDVLDHKTPGIYLLHAVSILVFGEVEWGIRALEILGVIGFGLVIGSLQGRRGRPVPDGVRGGGIALLALLYFGFFDFWNSAQSELWYSGLGMAAVWAAVRIERLPRASLVAGLFAGAAILMKPPAVWFVLLAVGMITARVWRDAAPRLRALLRAALLFGAGAAALPVCVLAYFGAKHALFAMQDIVVGANAYYVKHEAGAPPGFTWVDISGSILTYFAPFTVLFPLGAVVLMVRRPAARRASLLAFGATLAGVLAVAMQGKYYLLHWGAAIVPLAYLGVAGMRGLVHPLAPRWRAAVASFVVVTGYVSTAWIPHNGVADHQHAVVQAELDYLRDRTPRSTLDAWFGVPSIGFSYAQSRRVGDWLREHTTPDDNVAVRGFQPEIYAIAHRRHIGRFFWTTFLTADARKYHREEWSAEDLHDLQTHPPKYAVTLTLIHDGPDSTEWFAKLGYHPVADFGEFTIVAR